MGAVCRACKWPVQFCRDVRQQALSATALALLVLVPLLSEPVSPQESTSVEVPTFRSTTRLVVLDVIVSDRSGQPVGNLTRGDFTLLEDGVPQSIASFESPGAALEMRGPGRRGGTLSKSVGGRELATAAALNVVVLDELNSEVLDQAYGRFAIEKFLKLHGPRLPQPTSLMLLGQKRLEALHDYTQDAKALAEALHQRRAELPFGLMTGGGIYERLSKTLWAIQQIASANNHFAGRKNLIWIGPGFPGLNVSRALDAADRHRLAAQVGDTANLLLEARLAIYTIDPRGLEVWPVGYAHGGIGQLFTGTHDPASGDLLFESLAPETGGRIFRLRNDLEVAVATSVEDGEHYYTLSYYPSNHDWEGKYRNVSVTLRGEALEARTRKGYYAVPEAEPTDDRIDTILSRAVMNPLVYRGLAVTATAKRAPGQSARYIIKVSPEGLSWQTLPNGKRRCEVTVVTASVASADRVISHKVRELEALEDGRRLVGYRNKPVVFEVTSELPPSTSLVRVVVRDMGNGHIGSIDLPQSKLPVR